MADIVSRGLNTCSAFMSAVSRDIIHEDMRPSQSAPTCGIVEMIRGLANPKSGGARSKVHSQPQPCLKCVWGKTVWQGRREGKDCDVQTGIIQFEEVRKEWDIRHRLFALMDTERDGEGNDSGIGNT